MEVVMQRGEGEGSEVIQVKRWCIDDEGHKVGASTNNILLDTRNYNYISQSGDSEIFAANIIAENLLSQIDEERHQQLMIDEIINHRSNSSAIPKYQETYFTRCELDKKKKRPVGDICVWIGRIWHPIGSKSKISKNHIQSN